MSKIKRRRRRQFERLENPKKIFKQMTRDHLDVLQNIEFAIVSACRRCGDIDDSIIAEALQTAIADGESGDELSSLLINELADVRQVRGDVPETIWKNGLKVVLESVHTHSHARPGNRDYIQFIRRYVV